MADMPKPPDAFVEFVKRFPKVGESWRIVQDAGLDGPLDDKSARLVKLGIAIGTLRAGAVHSSVRKALAAGATVDEVEQVIALAAGTIGFPSAVAVFTWVSDEIDS